MTTFRDMPIKEKLMVVIIATTAVALLLAGIGILVVDTYLFRTSLQHDLTTLATIIGDNSTAALAFGDARVAKEVLDALHSKPHIVEACTYAADGNMLARYGRPGAPATCPQAGQTEIGRFGSDEFLVSHPILLDNRRIGTLVMLYDLGEVTERTKLYGGVVLLVLLASSFLAFLFSTRLRAVIAMPVTRLAEAARKVTQSGSYAIRVQRDSGDELGILVDCFNEMLERIESRDIEVQNARTSLETTLTSIGDAVVSTDAEGRVVFANPVARSLLRWSEPEIIGKPIAEVFHIVNEFTRQKVESPVDKVIREGRIVGLANHTILIARDGTEIPIDDSAAPIVLNGRAAGVVLVFRDITERRRAQQDAAYLAAIVESSEDAVVGKSPDGTIQSWNAGAERLYGWKAEEVVGHPMRELLPIDRQHEESDILEQMRDGQHVVHFETTRVKKDGTPVEVALTISPIRNKAGEVIGVSHVARDITEQKKAAEQIRQTQKLESLGILAGGIAHDFNNLLTGILGNASLVLEELPPDSRARALVEAVLAASERAAQLTRQMLAYSGKGRFVVEQINVSNQVRDTLPLIKAAIPPNVELRLNLDENVPPVEADATQIQQLIMNIIINGAEAIPDERAGTVSITTRREQVEAGSSRGDGEGGELPSGVYVVFEVADTGAGMDEETKARIFDPFFTTKFTGRGLGLAAVLGIVRGHRGSIRVSSTLGQGTVFRVLLPAAAAPQELKPGKPEAAGGDLRGEGLVMVVDDETIVRSLARQTLERYGYTVIVAENGARALEIFRAEAPRLRCVVLDLTMPVMSGEETLAHMKQIRRDVPIILSSGFNEAQAVRKFAGKGLAGFLQKPYKAAALVEKVRGAIAGAEAR